MLQIFPSSPAKPLLEAENSGWRAAPQLAKQTSANFSAVCWLFGRDLQRALNPPRPIGLIEASLGGTTIQAWSSADALSRPCTVDNIIAGGTSNGGSSTRTGTSGDADDDNADVEPVVVGSDGGGGGDGEGSNDEGSSGGLWNGLIEPLVRSTIYGAIWYQGESNSGEDGR